MTTRTQSGYLVLADISGYTGFLAGTELEHAHEIMSELLELIISRLTPALTLSKLEGDAVFVYAPADRFGRGEMLLEIVEATYTAFRDKVESVRRRTTCECAACLAIPTLDLKFMAHYGDFILQSVAGRQEVVGSDVNLAHRLMKNHVVEATGWRAYALFSAPCLQQTGLAQEGLHTQAESYEHLGEIQTYSLDLHACYKKLTEARRQVITPAEADIVATHDVAAPPAVVWDWLNDPYKRGRYMMGATWTAEARAGGRTAAGARNHCAHGKGAVVEEVLDWRPFEYYTSQMKSGPMGFSSTTRLEPTESGTRLHYTMRVNPPVPLPRMIRRVVGNQILKQMVGGWQMMDGLIAEERRE
jgi:uncharacterized protein YndB with AHSA1/START domain